MFQPRLPASSRPRGNVLLLALLMLAGGIVGGLTIALLVVSELRQARTLDNALTAYFDAESGLEQSLWEVRQDARCENVSGTACKMNAFADCNLPRVTSTVNNETPRRCDRLITPAPLADVPRLRADDTFQLDLNASDCSSNCVTGLTIDWQRVPYDLVLTPLLVVSTIEVSSSGVLLERPVYEPYRCNNDYEDEEVACEPIELDNLAGVQQVRLKALRNSITNLVITPTGGQLESYVLVRSRGDQTGVRQVLRARIPRELSAFGFADYVVFSEEDITK